jgi:hypothetical protein
MSNTLLGLGIVALIAAIVGGGLKAFGFEFPAVNSARRQISLGALGIVLILAAEWSAIEPFVFSPVISETSPITLDPAQLHSIPLSLNRSGAVDVRLQSLTSDWTGFTGQRGLPGQDSVLVAICSSAGGSSCPGRQLQQSQALRQELPAGSGAITIFNFATNPKIVFTLRIERPR